MTNPSNKDPCAKSPAASAVRANEPAEEGRVSPAIVASLIRCFEQLAERLDSSEETRQIAAYALRDNLDHRTVQAHSLANKHKIRGLQWTLETLNEVGPNIDSERLLINRCIKNLEKDGLLMSRSDAEGLRQTLVSNDLWLDGQAE